MTQAEALAIMKTGRNIFLTGEPGAGKSYTIRQYVNYLRSSGVEPAITASTGIAATHIGGMTLHSWSGIGIAKALTAREVREIAGRDRVAKRIQATRVLIIDEISMFDGNTLGLVDAVCRAVKESEQPFGGLQVIFVGDFFQLPPVSRQGDPVPQFAFGSDSWLTSDPTICYLSEQHRQEDKAFLDVLAALRRGQITSEHRDLLSSRQAEYMDDEEHAEMTKLFSHNVDVDRMNAHALSRIEVPPRTYAMAGYGAPPLIDQLKRGCLSPEVLTLKQGAQVMFTKNSSDGLYVNGTTGEVIAFVKDTGYPQVRLRSGRVIEAAPTEWKIDVDGKTLATISQIPLRLAWAMTVHKSQGMSLDAALIDLSSAFAYGQGYVALSRVRSLAGLHLRGLNDRALEVDPTVLAQDKRFRQQSLEAKKMLDESTPEQMAALHEQFVLSCGGKLNGGRKVTPTKKARVKEKRYEQTLALIKGGMTIEQVAKERSRTVITIFQHLEELREVGCLPVDDLAHLIADMQEDVKHIHARFRTQDNDLLKPIFEAFQGNYTYDQIRLARLFLPPYKNVKVT